MNRFDHILASLSPQEQTVLELLSLFYAPVRTDRLLRAFEAPAEGKPGLFLTPALHAALTRLRELRLVEQANRDRVACRPEVVEPVTRRALEQGRFPALARAVQNGLDPSERWGTQLGTPAQGLRNVRLALFSGDIEGARRATEECRRRFPGEFASGHPYRRIFDNPFDPAWMRTLPEALLSEVLTVVISDAVYRLDPAEEYFGLLEARVSEPGAAPPERLRYFLAAQYLWRGLPEAALELYPEGSETAEGLSLRAWISFLKGEDAAALGGFEAALGRLRKEKRTRQPRLSTFAELFHSLALLRCGDPKLADRIAPLTKPWGDPIATIYLLLRRLALLRSGRMREAALEPPLPWEALAVRDILGFFQAVILFWENGPGAKVSTAPLEAYCNRAADAGYLWFAGEAADLLSRLDPSRAAYGEQARALRLEMGTRALAEAVKVQEPWERALEALEGLGRAASGRINSDSSPEEPRTRIAWFVGVHPGFVSLEAREQRLGARGVWGKGKPIPLRHLAREPASAAGLTEHDRGIRNVLGRRAGSDLYGRELYGDAGGEALLALVGHPLVFRERDPQLRLEVLRGEPELRAVRRGEKIRIELHPDVGSRSVVAVEEGLDRLRVFEVPPHLRQVAEVLGKGIEVPAEAEEHVRQALAPLASLVTVHSDVGAGPVSAEEVPADPKPRFQLRPQGLGLRLHVAVRPLGEGGPSFAPGSGGATVIAEVAGRRLLAHRELGRETREADAAVESCACLAGRGSAEEGWLLEEPEACLELLEELQARGEAASLEWPEGQTLRLAHRASLERLRLQIRGSGEWFAVSGELPLDEALVLDLGRLLELVRGTPSRFLPLGDGRFLALTKAFRRRLEELDSFAERHGRGLRFHPLAAPALEELASEAGSLDADQAWTDRLERLREAFSLDPPVPATLQAELRDYQREGYRWLARLAHAGAGACLADDMGLGKTVQALAVLLARASQGPALVVAPTSVCANWEEEARRFAPALRPVSFSGADRERLLATVGPFDLVITSYGLLHQEAERLGRVEWGAAVLDEAQAIKNMATRRSQAAMGLRARFRLITTGTPIENHLGELWNLFRFLNPGLLGSLQRFNERFAGPIERGSDRRARERLKRLIGPFLLRRTKSQVLEELPPRTEIVRHVELSTEERALYEALRRQALERVSTARGPAGQQRLVILAEIMKLRRACCHPRLVLPESAISGAKLEAFAAAQEELRENRHRALVFSQFVDHLAIVRGLLDDRGIPYQYLDGSTPARERKKRVDAFQAGEGDLFLISLKAGGTGINLTAADYVLHLDPWWNPAVEDQASDRTHRIGQTRPVTVYRFVARDTIEEKIVDLHRKKRDLAESLLEGADVGVRLSVDELLGFLREG